MHGYTKEKVESDIKQIYGRLLEIYKISDEQNIPTFQAAKVFAKNRIESVKKVHLKYNEPR